MNSEDVWLTCVGFFVNVALVLGNVEKPAHAPSSAPGILAKEIVSATEPITSPPQQFHCVIA